MVASTFSHIYISVDFQNAWREALDLSGDHSADQSLVDTGSCRDFLLCKRFLALCGSNRLADSFDRDVCASLHKVT